VGNHKKIDFSEKFCRKRVQGKIINNPIFLNLLAHKDFIKTSEN
jgi:hypothetical protein